jgi:hypothetical protein
MTSTWFEPGRNTGQEVRINAQENNRHLAYVFPTPLTSSAGMLRSSTNTTARLPQGGP